jgi:cytosine/adenosine deaminase-related metal-dependent hydrolase
VASDVGGGTSLSMQRTLADGYQVQALRGRRLTALRAARGHAGAAQALGLAHEIGRLEPGLMADLCAVGLGGRRRSSGAARLRAARRTCTNGLLPG